MCWSAEVSLGFALAEFAILAYLWHRNQNYDRTNALLHVPIALQELGQFAIWLHIAPSPPFPEGNSLLQWATCGSPACSSQNKTWTFATMAVVGAVPLWITLVANFALTPSGVKLLAGKAPAGPPLTICWKQRGKMAAQNALLYTASASAYFALALFYWSEDDFPRCTCAGPHSHQIWPITTIPNRLIRAMVGIGYFLVGGGFALLPHPSLVPSAFRYINLSMPFLVCFYGSEWGSVWCWASSMLCLIYLFEPCIFRRHKVLDKDALRPTGQHLRESFMFQLAHGHLPDTGGDLCWWSNGDDCESGALLLYDT